MYKVLIIVDKFKGSLTAREVAAIIGESVTEVRQDISVSLLPLADGGDGTIEALESRGCGVERHQATDPLGRAIEVPVLKLKDGVLCEMAKSSGISLLSKEERNPLITTTYGLGEVIMSVARAGHRSITIGIGGSATNDGGAGMLQALGFRFYDRSGDLITGEYGITGGMLSQIHNIDDSSVQQIVRELKIRVACDVNNPLLGDYGATKVYGPQKGAGKEALITLEEGMVSFSRVCKKFLKVDLSENPGSGAAGGVGFALSSFLGAEMVSGWRLLFDIVDADREFSNSHLIITGEGRTDGQSLSGKLLDGVIELSQKYKRRLWIICGDNLLTNRELEMVGVERLFSISQIEPNKERAISNAEYLLRKISRSAATFIKPFTSNEQTIKTQ